MLIGHVELIISKPKVFTVSFQEIMHDMGFENAFVTVKDGIMQCFKPLAYGFLATF